ncbi:MAG: cytochrome c biogenesis protein ResB [Coriobacteriia bacterium]
MSDVRDGVRHGAEWILRQLRSRRFSGWLIGAWIALVLVWLVPFQVTGQPDETINEIATRWWPMVIVQVLLLAATLLCTFDRARRDLRRARQWSNMPRRLVAPVRVDVANLDDAASRLGSSGLSVVVTGNTVIGVRRPWAALGGSVFHLALAVIVVGVVLDANLASSVAFRLTETQAVGQSLVPESELAADVLGTVGHWTLTGVEPEYYRDVLLFTRLDAAFADGSGRAREMSLSRPIWLGPSRTLTIQDYGFALRVVADTADGIQVSDSAAAMDIFPPGKEDSVDVPGTQIRLHIVLFPDHGVVDGRDVSMSYALRDPKLLVTAERITPDREVLARALVAPGQPVETPYGTVTVAEVKRFGSFKVNSTPGLWFLVAGWVLASGGLAVRLLARRFDVVVEQTGEGFVMDAWLDTANRAEALRLGLDALDCKMVGEST